MTQKAVHTTDRERFKRCRLLWDFSSPLRQNLVAKRTNPNLTFGSAWHGALEAYYDPQYYKRDPDRGRDVFIDYVNDWFKGIENPDVEDEQRREDHLALGLGMLDHYFRYAYKHDRFKVLWVERPFEVELPGFDVPYMFKPDMFIEDNLGRKWVWENKTASSIPKDTDYLLMDEQCGSYLWGIKQALGVDAEGVLYNIALKKLPAEMRVLKSGLLSLDKRIVTTYEVAQRQIAKHHDGAIPTDYAEFLDRLLTQQNPFFYRENVRRNAREIEYLGEMIKLEAKDMLDPNVAIYRNPSRFNCSGCLFIGPCLAKYEGADITSMLEGNYERSERY